MTVQSVPKLSNVDWKVRWRPTPPQMVRLLVGLTIFGGGEALLIEAHLGNTPWTVLSQGIGKRTNLSVDVATFFVGLAVLACWAIVRERPGLGTVCNAIVIPIAMRFSLEALQTPHAMWARSLVMIGGVLAISFGCGLYISAHLGPGPRDGLMTGIHTRTKIPIARVRLAIEAAVFVVGWALGGVIGVGTVCFALFVGPLVARFLRLFGWSAA